MPKFANAIRERAELTGDQFDSSLSLVRYIAWAIPAIDFIGTVRGISGTLSFAEWRSTATSRTS